MRERRKYQRKFAEIHAEIVIDDLHLQGKTINISENGCLIDVFSERAIRAGLVNRTVSLWLTWEKVIIESTARVVRIKGNELALEIVAIDIKDICSLKSKLAQIS